MPIFFGYHQNLILVFGLFFKVIAAEVRTDPPDVVSHVFKPQIGR